MRKRTVVVIFVIVTVILLTSCSQMKLFSAKAPDLNRSFVSEVVIRYDETEVKAAVTRYGTGLWGMNVSEPETLAGLNIIYDENGVTASFGDLSFGIPFEKINSSAVFAVIFRVIDNAAAMTDMDFEKNDDGLLLYSGTADGYGYHLLFDSELGMLRSLSVPEFGLDVEILSVMPLSAD